MGRGARRGTVDGANARQVVRDRARSGEAGTPAATAAVAQRLAAAALGVVLHESATERLADVAMPSSGEVVLVVGPEGGITDDELATFAAAGAQVCRIGDTVLRTSTAGVVALATLQTPR
jgi:16S rRNA (uracil1498-N3)-methyltransferase